MKLPAAAADIASKRSTREPSTMTVAVSPIYFTVAGSHIVELGDLLHVGLPAREVDTRERLAYVGEHVARKLKVLSDPSRVAILADLVRRPASITELADRFQLAQPTVSMHIKALRDAQLLTATKNGTRTTYGVDAARLREQFEEIEALLLPKSCRASGPHWVQPGSPMGNDDARRPGWR